jgi:predicted phosphodiesterase
MDRPTRHWIAVSSVSLLLGGLVGLRALTEPRNDFRFSIIGDRTGGAQAEIYGRVWREVDLLHPDFVINVGDTIEGGNDQTAEKEWIEMRPFWEKYKHYPLYFTAGNHDVFSDTSRKLYERETGRPASYSFDYQETHFTVLDNAEQNELPDSQLAFLKKDLEENKAKNPKFVFFHRPFWLPYAKFKTRDFELHRIAKQYGVSYIISGHGHQFVRAVNDGIVYMEVGSSGGFMKGLARGEGFNQGWFYHHVWARVKGSKIEFTVKEIDGKGQGRMFRADEWGDSGPTFDIKDPASTEKPRG